MQGKIVKISGPLIVAEGMADSKIYSPVMEEEERARLLHGGHRAVRAARAWAEE